MALAPAPIPSIGLVLGPGYSLSGEAGSFALTGLAAGLELNSSLGTIESPAPLPSMASLFSVVPNKVLVAEAGSFQFDFAPSLSDFAVTAETGSFAMTGSAATLIYTRRALVAEAGAFVLTGQFATLVGPNEYRLVAEAGTFAISGVDAGLNPARFVAGETGSFAITGQAATFIRGKVLTAEAGAFSVAGVPANLSRTGGVVRYGRRGRRSAGTFPRRTNTVF